MLHLRLTVILVAVLDLPTDGIAQRCSSTVYNFPYHTNEEPLDLNTPADTVIVRYPVANVASVAVMAGTAKPTYIDATLGGGLLTFRTTGNFTAYEEHEVSVQIMVQLSFRCATGTQSGLFAQTLRLANNHVPRFRRERYEATVPLPLPKRLDLTPFLAGGEGIVARDPDLLNNSVRFGVSANPYVEVERGSMGDDGKTFWAVLRLKEQLLRLPDPLDLVLTGEDEGMPPKASNVTLVIRQDPTIVYDDPPAFKKRLINVSFDEQLRLELELFPSSLNGDVQFALEGVDAAYFNLTASEDHSKVTVRWNGLHEVPKRKSFLNIVAVAKRHEIPTSEAVVVVNLPVDENRVNDGVTIDKVLVVKRLEEESPHDGIFPLAVENCNYVILSQEPGEYFFINNELDSLSSLAFDREDRELFQNFDVPQFRLTLKLQCPKKGDPRATDVPPPPWEDIDYSTVRTLVHVLVDDINDNRPVFTFPKNAATFAFPAPALVAKFLPEQLLQVQAHDLDFGLNATIRYSLAPNDHFRIDPKTGVVYPLKHAMSSSDAIRLDVQATDRDGAPDGHVSELQIKVLRASEQHLTLLTMEDQDLDTFDATLLDIEAKTGLRLVALRRVYSSSEETVGRQQPELQPGSTVLVQAIVYALQDDELVTSVEFTRALEKANVTHPMTVSNAGDHATSQLAEEIPPSEMETYVYIVVTALFGTLAITMAGLAAYLWFYGRQIVTSAEIASDQVSTHSDSYIVQNAFARGTSPPSDYLKHNSMRSSELFSNRDRPRQKVTVRPLADLLESDEELDGSVSPETQDRTRNIKFNERVERIEVFP